MLPPQAAQLVGSRVLQADVHSEDGHLIVAPLGCTARNVLCGTCPAHRPDGIDIEYDTFGRPTIRRCCWSWASPRR